MANVKATHSGSGEFSKQHSELPHLISHGLSKEVGDVRTDVAAVFAPDAAITVDEFTAPATSSVLLAGQTPKARAGATILLHEFVDGARISPPTGTLTFASSHWVYTPATAPNGTHNYVIFYEYDATQVADAGGPVVGGAPYVNNNTGP
jgi:hypothetical protein